MDNLNQLNTFLDAIGIGSGNSGYALFLADFKTGCCILALDLTPDMCSKYNFVLFHFQGILRILKY